MIIPLSILTLILTAAYGYAAYRLLPFETMANSLRIVSLTAIIGCILLGPISQIVRIFYEHSAMSDAILWVAYASFGFFSMALFLVIVRDLGLLASDLASGAFLSSSEMKEWAGRREFWTNLLNTGILALTVGLTLYGFYNARARIRISRVTVSIEELPPGLEGFTIAQISDLHVGPTIKEGFVRSVVNMVNGLSPDLIAITGDMVDGSVPKLRKHVAPLADLRSKHGTYYVTGNHEYYSGALQWVGEAKRLGMEVLLNEHRLIEHKSTGQQCARMVIGGVTDYTAGGFIASHASDAQKAFLDSPESVPRILLAHQPRSIFAALKVGIDLQISGHTHGGQYFPGNLFVPLQQPVVKGLHRFDRAHLYVSCGTGYWGPPLRVGTSSEIALIQLTGAAI